MEKDLKTQEKSLTDDITNLNKKVSVRPVSLHTCLTASHQSKYLEKQFNDAQSQLRDIVSNQACFQRYLVVLTAIFSSTVHHDNRLHVSHNVFYPSFSNGIL